MTLKGPGISISPPDWIRVALPSNHPQLVPDADGLSVKAVGAVGDGEHDDTSAIQAAIDAAIKLSCDVIVPTGRYLIRGTLKVGKTVITDYAPIVNRTAPLDDNAVNALTNDDAVRANQSIPPVSLLFKGCPIIIADFTAGVPTPVFEHNLHQSRGAGAFRGPMIICSPDFVTGGVIRLAWTGGEIPNANEQSDWSIRQW